MVKIWVGQSFRNWNVIVFDLAFVSNTTLSCFLLFFLVINLYFLVPAFLVQVVSRTGELAMSIGIPTNEAKTEIETHPVIAETKISDCWI